MKEYQEKAMYANQIGLASGSSLGSMGHYVSPTIGENIDNRIASLQHQIDELVKVREMLPEGFEQIPIDTFRTIF